MIRVFAPLVSAMLLAGCMSQPPAPTVDRSSGQMRPSAAATPSGPGYYTVKRGDTLYRIALEHGQDYKDVAAWNNITNAGSIREGQVLRVAPPGAATAAAGGAVVAQPVVTAPVVETQSLDAPGKVVTTPAPTTTSTSSDGLKREPRGGKEPYSDEAYARLNRSGEMAPKTTLAAVDPKPEPKTESPEAKPEPKAEPATATGHDDVAWQWPSSGKVMSPYSDSGNKGLDFGGKAGDPVQAAADGKVVYAGAGLRGYGELVIVKHNATFLSAYAHNRKILVKEGQQVTRGQKIAEMGNTDSDSVKLHFEIRKQGKPTDPSLYLPKR
ncbi:MAG: peptidoglycan DD-metalloendopeptidase family protein [Azonexus sp.]|nr:peptidoglycan DD-metalloendopeptidase family protein [Azonexus sp.]